MLHQYSKGQDAAEDARRGVPDMEQNPLPQASSSMFGGNFLI